MTFEAWAEVTKPGYGVLAKDRQNMLADWKAEREKLIKALVIAAIPLEAINISVEWELADSIKWDIQEAVDHIRTVLAEVKEKK